MPLLITLLGLFVLLLVIMLIRTFRFRPLGETMQRAETVQLDEGAAIARFQQMLRFPTVSYYDPDRVDRTAFDGFKEFLNNAYPHLKQRAVLSYHGDTGILYHIAPRGGATEPGASDDRPVVVLMSHYDVVPVDAAQWTHAPFGAELVDRDGERYVWGRGALDTKSTLFAVVESVEHLLSHGYEPDCHLYLAFSGDEEISGQGAPSIVAHLESQGIRPDLVLDEGGAIVQDIFPGVKKPAAMVGVGEKGYLDVELLLRTKGGHSSTPPKETSVASLAKAVVALQNKPFPAHLGNEVRGMLDRMGRHSTFGLRLVLANLWLFRPLLLRVFGAMGGELAAMTRTTMAPTCMRASEVFNVIPSESAVGINLRLLSRDTVDSAIERMRAIVRDERIDFHVIESREASKISRTDSRAWQTVKEAIGATWGDVIVSPYLMVAATDSRHYGRISEHVLRFSAMPYTAEDLKLIHNHDERIRTRVLLEAVQFYINLLKRWGE